MRTGAPPESSKRSRDTEGFLAGVLDDLPCGVAVYDGQGSLVFANKLAAKLTGERRDASALPTLSLELNPADPVTGRRHQAHELPVARALLGETVEGFECTVAVPAVATIPPPAGSPVETRVVERVLRLSAVPRVDEGGQIVGAICTFADLTERARLERDLLHADRLASIGTLASGMAHEINNPLTYVLANVVFASEEVTQMARSLPAVLPILEPRANEVVRALEDARHGADRIRRVVGELKAFAQLEEDARQRVDVRVPLAAAVQYVQEEVSPGLPVRADLEEVPDVLASEGRLRQLFVNLIVTVAQLSKEEGGAKREVQVRAFARVAGESEHPDEVVVEVSDPAALIEPEALPRVFDPFFSIHPSGTSTGLGLATCQSIVAAHGGTLRVTSEPGLGTVFRVTFPADLSRAAPTGRPARGRVLVVDDEPSVLESIRRVLARLHDVTAVVRPSEALELLATGARRAEAGTRPADPRDTDFDVILCDVMMPEMSGLEFHARLGEVRPDLLSRVVFMTSGAFTPMARAFLASVPNVRITKPFSMVELRELVASRVRTVRGA